MPSDSSATARKVGAAGLLAPRRSRKVHAYAASFGDELAHELISSSTKPGGLVLDPFVGAGTTLVQARRLGRDAIGIDIDSVACLITTVLTTAYTFAELERLEASLLGQLTQIERELSSQVLDEAGFGPGRVFSVNGYDASIPQLAQVEFWFAPVQRAVIAVLVAVAQSYRVKRLRNIIELAISSAIVHKWPNTLSQAMDLDHSRPHRVVRNDLSLESQFQIFRMCFLRVLRALRMSAVSNGDIPELRVLQGDSVAVLHRLEANSADYILTSPPYFNAIDYPRAHQFPRWWLWPGEGSMARECYVGLKPGGRDASTIEKCLVVAPATMPAVAWLQTVSHAAYRKMCRYVLDLDSVVQAMGRVLKPSRPIAMVLANNSVREITVPVVDIVTELLQRHRFAGVAVEERKFDASRRRYPHGLKGFRGLMTSEYVIRARNRR
ncbi:MAG: site-specific DNA-methyltransferase [Chloroflexi bacterium]|nr:site-specific DNA-methyltransferase [Chloroflexota bacterium]